MRKYIDSVEMKKRVKMLSAETGVPMYAIAEGLGISRQALNVKLNAKRVSFDAIAEILDTIGYELHYEFVPKK